MFWVGVPFKLILILRKLIYIHSNSGRGYKVHLLTTENIINYLDDIPDYFYRLKPNHQSDYIRAHVLYKFGGIWLDSDTIVIETLDPLFDMIDKQDGFFIKESNLTVCSGVFGSKKRTPLMKEWKDQMRQLLDIKKEHIGWADIGPLMLQAIFDSKPQLYARYNILNGLNNLYPVNPECCKSEFLDKPYKNFKTLVRETQPLVIIVNSVYRALEDKTLEEIIHDTMPINYFINKSLQNGKISKQEFL